MAATISQKKHLGDLTLDSMISDKDKAQGIQVDLLQKVWAVMMDSLVEGEYKNLWVRLHHNSPFSDLLSAGDKHYKVLKYLFPLLRTKAREAGYNYLVLELDKDTPSTDISRKAGFQSRYIDSQNGSFVSECRLTPGESRWPKFRAFKEAITSVPLVMDRNQRYYVILGSKDNGAGRGAYICNITGYREPGEGAEAAARRETQEETGLSLPVSVPCYHVARSEKRDYYPGADDINDVFAFHIDLSNEENNLSLSLLEDGKWELKQIKHQSGYASLDGGKLSATDDLETVYLMPIEEALEKLDPSLIGFCRVQAAYQAVLRGTGLRTATASFGWKSSLMSYDDVKVILS